MSDWQPLRVTFSIYEVEGDNQFFDPERYTATIKLNSGANIQLDLGDPENSGSLYLKEQFDTLRISLKETATSQGYGSVSFDAEMFKENPVAKQWISLNSSALSDAFKGEIGRDQRSTPRIYLAYDAIPQEEGESRGRTATKRTRETSQLDKGSHDSRRKRSARSSQGKGKLTVRQNKSRVVTQKDLGGTKTTKVEKTNSLRTSKVSKSPVRSSSRGRDEEEKNYEQTEERESRRFGSSGRQEVVTTSTRRKANLGSGSNSITREKVVTRTNDRSSPLRSSPHRASPARNSGTGFDDLDHAQAEREIQAKTRAIAENLLREKSAIKNEEEVLISRLHAVGSAGAKLERDERELVNLKVRAEQELEGIRNEGIAIQKEEDRIQNDLIRQLEQLEQEHADIDAELEEEQLSSSHTEGRKVTIGGVDERDVEEINSIKNETQMVIDEIRDAVASNQVPLEESSFDPLFREDLERHAYDIIEKEKQRYALDLEGADVTESSLKYQRSQKDALQCEYDRVTTMYDDLANDIDRDLNDEMRELDDLRDYYRKLEEDRDHFRFTIESFKEEHSASYSLDAGSGPISSFNVNRSGIVADAHYDDIIKRNLDECEEAEKSRREAEIQLDKLYDRWRSNIERELDIAYVTITTDDGSRISKHEIIQLIVDNDKVTRSLNALLSDKERLENLLYLRKTNQKLTEVVKGDRQSINERMSSIRKEDKELMDELNKSDNALLSKNNALKELDDKMRILSKKFSDLEVEAQEKKSLITSLREKHEQVLLEIERLEGLISEDELKELEIEIRTKEQRLRDLQAEVDELELIVVEWKEKITIKERLVESRSRSRMLLFEPDPHDSTDQFFSEYVLSHSTAVPVKKIEKDRYLFGTLNIDIFTDRYGDTKVRMTNGEEWTLDQFVARYHDKELQKLEVLEIDEELIVDEKDDYKYQENTRAYGSYGRGSGSYAKASSTKRYEYSDNSKMGETFHGHDEYRPSDYKSSPRKSRMRNF